MIHIVKQNFFFGLTVAFLHIVFASPAFAQMGGSTYYSDAWGDGEYVYGVGVTEDYYNSYNHTFRAVTTMQSPLGRVSSYDTGYDSSAVAYVGLSFDENDNGIYTVNTDHFNYCENILREISLGSSTAAAKSGVTNVCFRFLFLTSNVCQYSREFPCPVTKCNLDFSHSYTLAPGEATCPVTLRLKYSWTEKVDGCGCKTNCYYRGTTTPGATCYCTEFGEL